MPEKTCSVCNGDCHDQNIKNFSKSTEWREKYGKAQVALASIMCRLRRWADLAEKEYANTGRVELHYAATNYLAEAEKIESQFGDDVRGTCSG